MLVNQIDTEWCKDDFIIYLFIEQYQSLSS